MLEFNIRNQEISRIDNFSPAEKSVEYLIAKFNFKTEDWNEAIKRAIFRNVKSKVEKDAMIEDDSCVVPWEVLEGSGDIEVSVHGVIGTEEITTDVAVFNLNRTLQGGSATQEPSPTVYEQMVEMVKDAKEVAQSVRNDADNGKFSGIPGPPGKDGKDGENGKDGDDGEDGKSAYDYAVEGGFKGTEQEFIDLMAQAGHVDLTGYVTKEQHEAALLKAMIKTTTDKAPHHHITDSANYRVVDFGMEGITEQYTGTITDDEGNEVTVPNQTHPQEIKLAGVLNEETGRYEIECCVGNKNWFDLKSENVAYVDNLYKPTITDIENGIEISFQKTRNACVVLDTKLYPNKTYTISCNVSIEADNAIDKAFNVLNVSATKSNWYRGDIAFAKYTAGKNKLKFTTPSDTENIKVYLAAWSLVNDTTGKTTITDFQIEIDSLPTDFIKHASQQFTLTSPVPITKWDKLVKRDGVYGWSIWSKYYENHIVTLSDWISVANTGMWDRFYINAFKSFVGANGKCNIFRWRGQSGNQENYVCGFMFSDALIVYLPKGELGIPDGASVSVSENKVVEYMSDKPLTICFETAKEVKFIPLPNEEQTLLKNLETYYGVTNVYNEQGCPISITYVNDPKLYVDNKLLEIQQAII